MNIGTRVVANGRTGVIVSDQAKFYGITIPDNYVVVKFDDKVKEWKPEGGNYLGEMVLAENCQKMSVS